ncbi:MAG TPA: hypothetical protein VFA33_09100 [Bryobacteraceae bacterium]|nr:hypothetical protein [Bryobacteraceae bacterium]
MACSAAPQHSLAQQNLVKQMAERASNGKELLLVAKAARGVFTTPATPEEQRAARAVCSTVAAKLIKAATLEQLTECAIQYPVNSEDARPLVERMFQLAEKTPDPQTWYQVTRAARCVKVEDLAQQALAKGGVLSRP